MTAVERLDADIREWQTAADASWRRQQAALAMGDREGAAYWLGRYQVLRDGVEAFQLHRERLFGERLAT